MPSGAMGSFDGRLYRAALSLCPAAFLREHGHEMALDFDEARGDAAATGDRALWILWLLMAVDLARTFGVQWLRTGIPVFALASILVTLALAAGLATLGRLAVIRVPPEAIDSEILGVLLLAVVAVMVIGMTIVLTLWVNPLGRRGRR